MSVSAPSGIWAERGGPQGHQREFLPTPSPKTWRGRDGVRGRARHSMAVHCNEQRDANARHYPCL